MKRKKRVYGGAALLLAAVLAAALVYARPMGVRQITGIPQPEILSVRILRRNADMELEQRELTLSKGDAGFDDLLARLDQLEFRRPPTNLIRMALPSQPEMAAVKGVEGGDFHQLYLSLSAPTKTGEWANGVVSFWVDEWSYQDDSRGLTLPLLMADSKAIGQDLCAELWEKAQPVES